MSPLAAAPMQTPEAFSPECDAAMPQVKLVPSGRMAGGWVEWIVQATGAKFFYNARAGRSQIQPPYEFTSVYGDQ